MKATEIAPYNPGTSTSSVTVSFKNLTYGV
jgi:hypothetical protein